MAPRTDFPPVRACLFDMDGLLLNTEDIYTHCINLVLAKYSRPPLPWSLKAKLQGRPGPQANALFHEWAQLPIPNETYLAEYSALQRTHFPSAAPLPGVETLLADLHAAAPTVHLALATSSNSANFKLKTQHLEQEGSPGAGLFAVFAEPHRVLGDDPRIAPGRGKPLPDIYLLALQTINDALPAGEPKITPEECLVFEDSVPGVEAGRRAGMRVVWVPHPELRKLYEGQEEVILAGRMGEAGEGVEEEMLGEIGDGWGVLLDSLEGFDYKRYGIEVPQRKTQEGL